MLGMPLEGGPPQQWLMVPAAAASSHQRPQLERVSAQALAAVQRLAAALLLALLGHPQWPTGRQHCRHGFLLALLAQLPCWSPPFECGP